MTFWDSSAVLPLVVEEARSTACRALRRAHPSIAVWALTRVEVASGIHRVAREGLIEQREVVSALARLNAMAHRWAEIGAVVQVRDRAERALRVHPLTASDALQLGAALLLVGERTKGRAFITADDRLATAALAEGFTVHVPTD